MKFGFQVLHLNSLKYFHNTKQQIEHYCPLNIWYDKQKTTWWFGTHFNNRKRHGNDGMIKLQTSGKRKSKKII